MLPDHPVRVLYLGGVPHSGSTVLARVLGEVEGLFAAGEVYALGERVANGDLCGCGVPLGECPFWIAVLRTAFPEMRDPLPDVRTERRWIRGRTLPAIALGRDRRRLARYRGALGSLYAAIGAVSGCRVVVDSSKSPTYEHILEQTPGIELFAVHLVRDARATSYSWSVDPHYHRTRGPAFGARWALWNLELELLAARRARRSVRVRLEDFVRDPAAETRRVLGVVGAAGAELPFVDGRSARLPAHHMVEGHASRLDSGVIPIRASAGWCRGLSRRRELATSLTAAPLQLRYGYPLLRRGAP